MSTTEIDPTEAARLASLTKGYGHEAARLAQADAEQQAAHEKWLADGGEEGEKRRAAEAAEDARAIAAHSAGMEAQALSYEKDVRNPPGYTDQYEALEAGIADPKVGSDRLFTLFQEYTTALLVAQEIQTHGSRGIVIARGGAPGPYHGQPPLPEFVEVQQRAIATRAANAAAEKATEMHGRAQAAYGAAAK
jgi:hypothetical protein